MITLTEQLIKNAQTYNKGWTRKQLEVIGVSWPPRAGWIKTVCGIQISEKQYNDFCKYSDTTIKE